MLAAGEYVAGPPKHNRLLIVRYTKTGRPDNSFGHKGIVARTWASQTVIPPNFEVTPKGVVPNAITFDARGNAVIAGTVYTVTPVTRSVGVTHSLGGWFLARLTHNGFGCSFGSSGVVFGSAGVSTNAMAVQADGRIVIAGERDHELVAARYMGGGTPRPCPGDHKSHRPKHKHKHRHQRRRHR